MNDNKQSFQADGIMEKGYGFIPKLIMKDKELTIEAKAIYAYLSSYTGTGNTAYPSISLMCGDLDISEARFYKHRKLLIEKGYIVIEKKRNEGGWSNNVYKLPFKPYPQNLCTQNLSIQNEGTKSNRFKSNSLNNKDSASKNAQHTITDKDVEAFFERVWSLYPNKVGKGRISNTKKKKIYKLGEEFERCISRYIKYVEAKRKKDFKDLKYQNGSTFFNSGYVDYLDKNVKDKPKKDKQKKHKPKFIYREL